MEIKASIEVEAVTLTLKAEVELEETQALIKAFSSPNASTQYPPQYQQQQISSLAQQRSQTTFQGKSERPTCQIYWKI
jgi:hypothetical protein